MKRRRNIVRPIRYISKIKKNNVESKKIHVQEMHLTTIKILFF